MTAAKIRRGKGTRPKTRRKPPLKRKQQGSTLDRVIKALPVSDQMLRRVLTILILAGSVVIAIVAANMTGVSAKLSEETVRAVGRVGFEVKKVEVIGVDRIDQMKVYEIALNQKNRSMAAVDLEEVRADLMQYGWISDARVSRRLPDTLVIDIVERTPSAVWQNKGELALIDREGKVLEPVAADNAPDLPLVIGPNANLQTDQLDALLDEAPALRPLLAGATWVGNRRWDLRFRTGEKLMLPEGEELEKAALVKFARLDGANRLLGRGIDYVDMRDPTKTVLRPRDDARPAASSSPPPEPVQAD